MSQGGRICRKVGRGGGNDDDFEVEDAGDEIRIRLRGRVVRTLTGAEAEAVRAVLDDPAALERLVARKLR
jgi:hypothetical protein